MRLTNGRRPAAPPSRATRVVAALVAAGETVNGGTIPMLDPAYHGLASKAWHDAVLRAGYTETVTAGWPCDEPLTDPEGAEVLQRHGDHCGAYRLPDGTIVLLDTDGGWFTVRAAAPSRPDAHATVTTFQGLYPALFATMSDGAEVTVPITFWVLGQFGPTRRLRRVESVRWPDITSNYSAPVRDGIAALASPDFVPGADGQLLLWHGPPGTGKTWALRALAAEWEPWAEFHCITDPDAFFVKDASYMVDVLLADSYSAIDPVTAELVEAGSGDKWRVLVLEDTGELLSADAKDRSGQGLSRLLNVVDGMIGQGLRILVLVTTNEHIETLHPAVTRPGRCASQMLFGSLDASEASVWLGRDVDAPMTLAELYAARAASEHPPADEPDVGLDALTRAAVDAFVGPLPDLDEPTPLPATTFARVREVAGDDGALEAALATLAASHRMTVEGVAALVVAAGRERRNADSDPVTLAALAALEKLAARPHPVAPAPVVNVSLPEREVTVNVEGATVTPRIDVHVPEQPAPVVNVAAAEAPVVNVAAPAAAPVHVHVPDAAPAVPPVVHVHPPAPTAARTMRVHENPVTGERTFTFDDPDADDR